MSPRKIVAKKSAKCPRHSLNSSRNKDANNAYIDYYKNVVINMERGVDLESLENTFILEVFKERTQTKLLNPSVMCMSASSRNSLQMHLRKMTISIFGSGGKNSSYLGS